MLHAASTGAVSIVSLLLEHGAVDLGTCDADGATALARACANGHTQVAQVLITKGKAIIDTKDGDAWVTINNNQCGLECSTAEGYTGAG